MGGARKTGAGRVEVHREWGWVVRVFILFLKKKTLNYEFTLNLEGNLDGN